MLSMDNGTHLFGYVPYDIVAQVSPSSGQSNVTTVDWTLATIPIGLLDAGIHDVTLGGYVAVSNPTQRTTLLFDSIAVNATAS